MLFSSQLLLKTHPPLNVEVTWIAKLNIPAPLPRDREEEVWTPAARTWPQASAVARDRGERMCERRQFVSDLFAATISTCALLVVPTQSLSLEDPLKSQLDKHFSAAVRRVAGVRETNRATTIVVTHLFKDLTDTHSLSDFRSYVAEHYKFTRVTDVVGNIEYAHLDDTTLKQFDRRFFSYDRLDINFRYSADWKDIVEFSAILRNLRL
jgi:hypothetical protein